MTLFYFILDSYTYMIGNNDTESNLPTFTSPTTLQSNDLSPRSSSSLLSSISPILPYHFNAHIIPTQPEFLFQIDTSRSRPFTLRLTYITGSGYLTGLTCGGLWGLSEGFISIFKHRDTSRKVKITAMLNSITRRGPFFANTLGIITMYFAFSEQIFRKFRGKEDNFNKIIAAFTAGSLWKCTRSLRALTFGGLIGGTIVGSYYMFNLF